MHPICVYFITKWHFHKTTSGYIALIVVLCDEYETNLHFILVRTTEWKITWKLPIFLVRNAIALIVKKCWSPRDFGMKPVVIFTCCSLFDHNPSLICQMLHELEKKISPWLSCMVINSLQAIFCWKKLEAQMLHWIAPHFHSHIHNATLWRKVWQLTMFR